MSTQQFQGKVEMLDHVEVKGKLNATNSLVRLGAKRIQTFQYSLAGIDGSSVNFSDNDILLQLGTLDVTNQGSQAATHIVLQKAFVNITEVAGTTLAANIALGSTDNEAVNGGVSDAVEILGLNATYVGPDSAGTTTSLTEADLALGTASRDYLHIGQVTAVSTPHVYLRTTTALSAALTQGKGTIVLEYFII